MNLHRWLLACLAVVLCTSGVSLASNAGVDDSSDSARLTLSPEPVRVVGDIGRKPGDRVKSVAQLSSSADLVIVGRTVQVLAGHHLSHERDGVVTRDVRVEVETVLKGEPIGSVISIDQIGFTVEGYEIHVAELPWSELDDRTVWFLNLKPYPDGTHYTASSAAGQIGVVDDAGTAPRTQPSGDPELETYADDPVSTIISEISLEQLSELVRRADLEG